LLQVQSIKAELITCKEQCLQDTSRISNA